MADYLMQHRARSREPEALIRGIRELVEKRMAMLTGQRDGAKPVQRGQLNMALDELEYVIDMLDSIVLPRRRYTKKGE